MVTTKPSLRTPTRGDRDIPWRIFMILFVGAIAAAFLWNLGAERRAIGGMDPAERRVLYDRAYGELQTLCGAGPRDDALEKRCVTQIEFIQKFPECDAPCQEIARRHLPRPTK